MKPTRNFIIIWTGLIVIFLGGLVTVFMLSQQNNAPIGDYFTGTAISATNSEVASNLAVTRTAEAEVTAVSGVSSPIRTPIPYDASMSPTALPPPEQLTRWAATITAHASLTLTLPPYDASMSPWAATMTARAATPSVTPTPSPAQAGYASCMFNWARQDLPDVTGLVQTALDEAGISYVTARAEAYGENCYRQDGSVSYFAAKTTDFYLTIPLENLNDEALMGQVVATTYAMLTAVPTASLPARLGYLDITFVAGEQSQRFRAMFDQLRPLIEAGENGTALLAAGVG